MTLDHAGLRDALETELAPSGAYRCTIDWGAGRWSRDENGFATAMVLRRARRQGVDLAHLDRSLDLLERCSTRREGPYSFWPPDTRPAWAAGIPPDADDTAAAVLELYAHGRRTRDEASRAATEVLLPAVTTAVPAGGPPWLRSGVFPTWLLGAAAADNPVDCAVNANVLALVSALALPPSDAYASALAMVQDAVTWCLEGGVDADTRADTIAPFYASTRAVVRILDDAVWCGVTELASTRDELATVPGAASGPEDALWRNANRGPTWRCHALELLSRAG